MTQLTENVFAVEVPEAAKCFDFEIDAKEDWYQLTYLLMIDDEDSGFYGEDEQHSIDIPAGNWQFICTTREVRAMHAPALFGHAMINDYYAQMTINSLLTSKGLDVSKNYALLKKG